MFNMSNNIPFQEVPETERNQKIARYYATGSYTYRSLARIFKISHVRISQIVKGEEVKKNEPTKTDSFI